MLDRNHQPSARNELFKEGMKKGGKDMFNKVKEKTVADFGEEFMEDLLGDPANEHTAAARSKFTKTLAAKIFKLK